MVLQEQSIQEKLHRLPETLQALASGESFAVPDLPGRDVEYLPIHFLSGRIGLSTAEGQQKLLHDLANIELQAMELGVRTLVEFPQAHPELREQLSQIVQEEAKHLQLCLQALESLGGFWGKWPVHLGLWHATHQKDSLLERLFIVHRYLEGSGLDAGDTLLRRLSGVQSPQVKQVVKTIVEEEVDHVEFGSRWFKYYAAEQKVDTRKFFARLCSELRRRHPRKDKVALELRERAGFCSWEIQTLQNNRAL